jgi:hypothetical protein
VGWTIGPELIEVTSEYESHIQLRRNLMPVLPLNHPEPFAATLGVMLYPGIDEVERRKAASFQMLWLAEPIRRLNAERHPISRDTLLHLAMHAGERLDDLDKRYWQGTATGESLKVLFALYNTNPGLASWNHAVTIVERVASCVRSRGSRSALWEAIKHCRPAAHLWAAWCIREERFETRPEVGYDGYADFQSFLAESEIIRDWAQSCLPAHKNGEPFLPPDILYPGEGWQPLKREPDWPDTGKIPVLKLTEDLLTGLKPAGRPSKEG